jgi:transposase
VLAGFRAARALGRISAPQQRLLDDALLDGYSAVAPAPDRAAIRWHTAASTLARIAVPAVSRVRADVLRRLTTILDAAP